MSSDRISFPHEAADFYRAVAALNRAVTLEPVVHELVKIRASQMNGCAFCIDMHATAARAAGEEERRIWALSAWRDTPFFDDRERAALALTEAATRLAPGGVPDDVYAEAARHFPDAELAQLIAAITVINVWNRISISTGAQPPVDEAVPAQGAAAGAA
jgi:AhpD family alkylhydroperoxidase